MFGGEIRKKGVDMKNMKRSKKMVIVVILFFVVLIGELQDLPQFKTINSLICIPKFLHGKNWENVYYQ